MFHKDPFFKKLGNKRVADDEELESLSGEEGSHRQQQRRGRGGDDGDVVETPDEKRVRLAQQLLREMAEDGGDEEEEEVSGGKGVWGSQRWKAVGNVKEIFQSSSSTSISCVSSWSFDGECGRGVMGLKDGTLWVGQEGCGEGEWSGAIKGVEGRVVEGAVGGVAWVGRGVMATGGTKGAHVIIVDTRVDAGVVGRMGGHGTGGRLGGKGVGGKKGIGGVASWMDGRTVCSAGLGDATIRVWDVRQMGLLETHWGHGEAVTGMQCWTQQKLLTCSEDRTAHAWHLQDQQQLVYRGPSAVLDSVCAVETTWSGSGGARLKQLCCGAQDGHVYGWRTDKKKPEWTIQRAHEGSWVTSVACDTKTGLLATGGADGYVRLWQCPATTKSNAGKIQQGKSPIACDQIKIPGFIVGLQWWRQNDRDLRHLKLVVTTGREHARGRWWTIDRDAATLGDAMCNGAKNSMFVVDVMGSGALPQANDENNDDEDDDDDNIDDEMDENEEEEEEEDDDE